MLVIFIIMLVLKYIKMKNENEVASMGVIYPVIYRQTGRIRHLYRWGTLLITHLKTNVITVIVL